mmetsp:Transcript_10590/g.25108  ORF Transcript_10590/g.25108 Transcript_10590/m.25108 type:complete len:255 (-) Transcript_10590:522-1286(-)
MRFLCAGWRVRVGTEVVVDVGDVRGARLRALLLPRMLLRLLLGPLQPEPHRHLLPELRVELLVRGRRLALLALLPPLGLHQLRMHRLLHARALRLRAVPRRALLVSGRGQRFVHSRAHALCLGLGLLLLLLLCLALRLLLLHALRGQRGRGLVERVHVVRRHRAEVARQVRERLLRVVVLRRRVRVRGLLVERVHVVRRDAVIVGAQLFEGLLRALLLLLRCHWDQHLRLVERVHLARGDAVVVGLKVLHCVRG